MTDLNDKAEPAHHATVLKLVRELPFHQFGKGGEIEGFERFAPLSGQCLRALAADRPFPHPRGIGIGNCEAARADFREHKIGAGWHERLADVGRQLENCLPVTRALTPYPLERRKREQRIAA